MTDTPDPDQLITAVTSSLHLLTEHLEECGSEEAARLLDSALDHETGVVHALHTLLEAATARTQVQANSPRDLTVRLALTGPQLDGLGAVLTRAAARCHEIAEDLPAYTFDTRTGKLTFLLGAPPAPPPAPGTASPDGPARGRSS